MILERAFTSTVVVAALCLVPLAASGQEGNGRERGGRRAASQPAERSGGGGGQAVVRQAPRQAAPAPAPSQGSARAAERPQYSAPAQQAPDRGGRQAVIRPQESRPAGPQTMPRGYESRPAPQAVPRSYENRQYGAQPAPRQAGPRQAVPRQQYGYRGPAYRPADPGYRYGNRNYGYAAPHYYYARPYYGRAYVRPYGWTPYRPYYFSRPYYSFRPWFSIGFGVSIGYPVPYPWTYLGSYRPRVYGYYDNSYGYDVTPDVSIYGGVSFDIQPADAEVWVDDQYAGTVGTFTPYGEPLTMTPGQHHVVIQRDGYRAMEWDVTVEPGQVIPYRGAMQRY